MVHKYSDVALAKINKSIVELRRLFLVDDLVDSIKVRTPRGRSRLLGPQCAAGCGTVCLR